MTGSGQSEYVVAHVEEALARDVRVAEQGLHVTVEDGCVVVKGTVSTVERRAAIAAVVEEVAPGHRLCNEAEVADYPERPDPEMVG